MTPLQKGDSVAYVPDMWFDGTGAVIPACAGQATCTTVPERRTIPARARSVSTGRMTKARD